MPSRPTRRRLMPYIWSTRASMRLLLSLSALTRSMVSLRSFLKRRSWPVESSSAPSAASTRGVLQLAELLVEAGDLRRASPAPAASARLPSPKAADCLHRRNHRRRWPSAAAAASPASPSSPSAFGGGGLGGGGRRRRRRPASCIRGARWRRRRRSAGGVQRLAIGTDRRRHIGAAGHRDRRHTSLPGR